MDVTDSKLLSGVQSLQGLDWITLLEALIQPTIRVLIVLLVWWALRRALRVALRRVRHALLSHSDAATESSLEANKRVDTLVKLLAQVVSIILFVSLALVLLMQLGVQVGPLLASAGVVGVAIGFGSQSLVRDVITGFFIVMENQIRVGDVASINGVSGVIEAMTLRTVVVRDLQGTVHVFPNGAIDQLANMTRNWSAYVFDIGVSYRSDPDQAIEVIRQVLDGLKLDPAYQQRIQGEPEIFGVDALGDSAVVIKGRIKTAPGSQWEVGREFLRRVKKSMDERGIEIPFPQRTLHLTSDRADDPRLRMGSDRDVATPQTPKASGDVP